MRSWRVSIRLMQMKDAKQAENKSMFESELDAQEKGYITEKTLDAELLKSVAN